MYLVRRVLRFFRKPPKYIFHRFFFEVKLVSDRIFHSRPDAKVSKEAFLRIANASSIPSLWQRHSLLPFVTPDYEEADIAYFKMELPDSAGKIFESADKAMDKTISLLGTGLFSLGEKILWNCDYKTQIAWPNKYYRDINYVSHSDKSDVKIPWEISRLQWMVPVAQAYLLSRDEKYASFVRDIITDWIQNNPYAHSVNWTCTMEVALRIIIFQYFFSVFKKSDSWQDENFQYAFLKSIYFHAYFTQRNLEKSDVNGNHYTADAAGLVFAGLFLKDYAGAEGFLSDGLSILNSEIILQVFEDGVDYEASIPYHRLVAELFFFPAMYLRKNNIGIESTYMKRLIEMGTFIQYYSRNDGSVPLWGDADDARTLPMGFQDMNEHLYLSSFIGLFFEKYQICSSKPSVYDEVFWIFGKSGVEILKKHSANQYPIQSKAFPNGGFYIMRSRSSHIFIDCGPIGLAGRGGHGHNDLLSFEAQIGGQKVITDSGAYLYTADYLERNLFRSCASHNTPIVDKQEINRFIGPKFLWNLHNDAQHIVHCWETEDNYDCFIGSHTGYTRLQNPITPVRKICLDKINESVLIQDEFLGTGEHEYEIPFHLDPCLSVKVIGENCFSLQSKINDQYTYLHWRGLKWDVNLLPTRISPSYGVILDSNKLLFTSKDALNNTLQVFISKEKEATKIWEQANYMASLGTK